MVFSLQSAKARRIQAVVCAVLLVCILIVVIAPQVDLLPTTLRTQRLSSALLIQLAALALALMLPLRVDNPRLGFIAFRETPARPLLSRLSVICVRLC